MGKAITNAHNTSFIKSFASKDKSWLNVALSTFLIPISFVVEQLLKRLTRITQDRIQTSQKGENIPGLPTRQALSYTVLSCLKIYTQVAKYSTRFPTANTNSSCSVWHNNLE